MIFDTLPYPELLSLQRSAGMLLLRMLLLEGKVVAKCYCDHRAPHVGKSCDEGRQSSKHIQLCQWAKCLELEEELWDTSKEKFANELE